MSVHAFTWGFDLPGEPDRPCEVCGHEVEDCECPECPECGEWGNPKCYTDHGLVLTDDQLDAIRDRQQFEKDQAEADDARAVLEIEAAAMQDRS